MIERGSAHWHHAEPELFGERVHNFSWGFPDFDSLPKKKPKRVNPHVPITPQDIADAAGTAPTDITYNPEYYDPATSAPQPSEPSSVQALKLYRAARDAARQEASSEAIEAAKDEKEAKKQTKDAMNVLAKSVVKAQKETVRYNFGGQTKRLKRGIAKTGPVKEPKKVREPKPPMDPKAKKTLNKALGYDFGKQAGNLAKGIVRSGESVPQGVAKMERQKTTKEVNEIARPAIDARIEEVDERIDYFKGQLDEIGLNADDRKTWNERQRFKDRTARLKNWENERRKLLKIRNDPKKQAQRDLAAADYSQGDHEEAVKQGLEDDTPWKGAATENRRVRRRTIRGLVKEDAATPMTDAQVQAEKDAMNPVKVTAGLADSVFGLTTLWEGGTKNAKEVGEAFLEGGVNEAALQLVESSADMTPEERIVALSMIPVAGTVGKITKGGKAVATAAGKAATHGDDAWDAARLGYKGAKDASKTVAKWRKAMDAPLRPGGKITRRQAFRGARYGSGVALPVAAAVDGSLDNMVEGTLQANVKDASLATARSLMGMFIAPLAYGASLAAGTRDLLEDPTKPGEAIAPTVELTKAYGKEAINMYDTYWNGSAEEIADMTANEYGYMGPINATVLTAAGFKGAGLPMFSKTVGKIPTDPWHGKEHWSTVNDRVRTWNEKVAATVVQSRESHMRDSARARIFKRVSKEERKLNAKKFKGSWKDFDDYVAAREKDPNYDADADVVSRTTLALLPIFLGKGRNLDLREIDNLIAANPAEAPGERSLLEAARHAPKGFYDPRTKIGQVVERLQTAYMADVDTALTKDLMGPDLDALKAETMATVARESRGRYNRGEIPEDEVIEVPELPREKGAKELQRVKEESRRNLRAFDDGMFPGQRTVDLKKARKEAQLARDRVESYEKAAEVMSSTSKQIADLRRKPNKTQADLATLNRLREAHRDAKRRYADWQKMSDRRRQAMIDKAKDKASSYDEAERVYGAELAQAKAAYHEAWGKPTAEEMADVARSVVDDLAIVNNPEEGLARLDREVLEAAQQDPGSPEHLMAVKRREDLADLIDQRVAEGDPIVKDVDAPKVRTEIEDEPLPDMSPVVVARRGHDYVESRVERSRGGGEANKLATYKEVARSLDLDNSSDDVETLARAIGHHLIDIDLAREDAHSGYKIVKEHLAKKDTEEITPDEFNRAAREMGVNPEHLTQGRMIDIAREIGKRRRRRVADESNPITDERKAKIREERGKIMEDDLALQARLSELIAQRERLRRRPTGNNRQKLKMIAREIEALEAESRALSGRAKSLRYELEKDVAQDLYKQRLGNLTKKKQEAIQDIYIQAARDQLNELVEAQMKLGYTLATYMPWREKPGGMPAEVGLEGKSQRPIKGTRARLDTKLADEGKVDRRWESIVQAVYDRTEAEKNRRVAADIERNHMYSRINDDTGEQQLFFTPEEFHALPNSVRRMLNREYRRMGEEFFKDPDKKIYDPESGQVIDTVYSQTLRNVGEGLPPAAGERFGFVKKGVADRVAAQEATSGKFMEALEKFGRFSAKATLATNAAWLVTQPLAESLTLALSHPNPASWVKAYRIRRKLFQEHPEEASLLQYGAGTVLGTNVATTAKFENYDAVGRQIQQAKWSPSGQILRSVAKLDAPGEIDRAKGAFIRELGMIMEIEHNLKRSVRMAKAAWGQMDAVEKVADHMSTLTYPERLRYIWGEQGIRDSRVITDHIRAGLEAGDQLLRQQDRNLGNWTAVAPGIEESVASVFFFYPFTRFSLQWTFKNYPADHPARFAVLSSLGAFNGEMIEEILGDSPNFLSDWAHVPIYDKDGKIASLWGVSNLMGSSNAVLEAFGDLEEPMDFLKPFQPVIAAGVQGLAKLDNYGNPIKDWNWAKGIAAFGDSMASLAAPYRLAKKYSGPGKVGDDPDQMRQLARDLFGPLGHVVYAAVSGNQLGLPRGQARAKALYSSLYQTYIDKGQEQNESLSPEAEKAKKKAEYWQTSLTGDRPTSVEEGDAKERNRIYWKFAVEEARRRYGEFDARTVKVEVAAYKEKLRFAEWKANDPGYKQYLIEQSKKDAAGMARDSAAYALTRLAKEQGVPPPDLEEGTVEAGAELWEGRQIEQPRKVYDTESGKMVIPGSYDDIGDYKEGFHARNVEQGARAWGHLGDVENLGFELGDEKIRKPGDAAVDWIVEMMDEWPGYEFGGTVPVNKILQQINNTDYGDAQVNAEIGATPRTMLAQLGMPGGGKRENKALRQVLATAISAGPIEIPKVDPSKVPVNKKYKVANTILTLKEQLTASAGGAPSKVPDQYKQPVAKWGAWLEKEMRKNGLVEKDASFVGPGLPKGMTGAEYLAKIIQAESNWDASASSAVASGLGQFIPGTRQALIDRTGTDAWSDDPEEQVRAVAELLSGSVPDFAGTMDHYNPGFPTSGDNPYGDGTWRYYFGQDVGQVTGGGKPSPKIARKLVEAMAVGRAYGIFRDRNGGGKWSYPLAAKGEMGGGPDDHAARAFGNWMSDNAVDIMVPVNTPVLSVTTAQVTGVSISAPNHAGNPAGSTVYLTDKNGEQYSYMHLESVDVKEGQVVKPGQPIGKSGAANSVPHLHFATMNKDPEILVGKLRMKGVVDRGPFVDFSPEGPGSTSRPRLFTGDSSGHTTLTFQRPFAKALIALAKASGEPLNINEGTRSYARQDYLFKHQGQDGIGVAAPPGTSNHEGGAAADIQLTPRQIELLPQFGLSNTVVAGEPWHVELVGGPGAGRIMSTAEAQDAGIGEAIGTGGGFAGGGGFGSIFDEVKANRYGVNTEGYYASPSASGAFGTTSSYGAPVMSTAAPANRSANWDALQEYRGQKIAGVPLWGGGSTDEKPMEFPTLAESISKGLKGSKSAPPERVTVTTRSTAGKMGLPEFTPEPTKRKKRTLA